MLQTLIGLVFAVIGTVFLYQSLCMVRVAREGVAPGEVATVRASGLVNDGHPTDPARQHYSVSWILTLADGHEVTLRRGFQARHEAEALLARLAPGSSLDVRRTGLRDPQVLLAGDRLEPAPTAGMGGLALGVGLLLLWLAWQDWRLILAAGA